MKTGSQEDMIDQLRDQVDELAMWKSARLEEDANPLAVADMGRTLTRREQFAMAAMQGALAGSMAAQLSKLGVRMGVSVDQVLIAWSVELADALIDRLDEVET